MLARTDFLHCRSLAAAAVCAIFSVQIAFAGGHASSEMAMKKDIVDTAVAAGSFNTLAAALQAAGLIDALKGDGPFTVFAPTDDAFAKLPAGTLDSLLQSENKETLKALLLYHVIPGKVMSSDISGSVAPETLEGTTISVVASDGGVTVNGANVIKADIEASNGVIHVIDAVINPAP